MNLYGLIGYPLSHSFSPDYFNTKFEKEKIEAVYKAFPIKTISELKSIIHENPGLKGLNVTIPYKQEVIEYLHEMDDEAAKLQAVNTIAINRRQNNLFLKGYNTDIYGFETSIKKLIKDRNITNALILGTGATSRTVIHALKKLSINIYQATRGKTIEQQNILNYENIPNELIIQTQFIVNTTPLGMYPDTNRLPRIPYDCITPDHILYDLIYNPSRTLFLEEGAKRGALVKNGYEMLVMQAEKSWEIWQSHI